MTIGRPTAVLFDFGSTLFAHASLTDTIVERAARLGTSVTRGRAIELAEQIRVAAHSANELQHARDLDRAVWAARWTLLYSMADVEVPGLGASLYEAFHAPDEWHPYEATADVLFWLHVAGVPVGVVSNTGWDVRRVFEHHGLDGLVSTFVLSCEVGCVKPSREMFDLACERLGAPVSEVLMVGDDPIADAGAASAGLLTLLVPAAEAGSDNGLAAVQRLLGR